VPTASPEAGTGGIAGRLARLIAMGGPIPLSLFMAEANAHYYATRDPFGAGGDFVTAPEISQMFGEMVGLALAELWVRAGRPEGARYVELGPGRGTLAADALRAMRAAGLTPPVELVETSPALRAAQATRVPQARWHGEVGELPGDGPLLVVANEFFDALPVTQHVRGERGWHARLVDHREGGFVSVLNDAPTPGIAVEAEAGAVIERCLSGDAVMRELASRVARQGGVIVAIDYGYVGPAIGDTLQAVRGHGFADPLADPGEQDITAHVDFTALADAARAEGLRVTGPVGQGAWLESLGIGARAAALSRAAASRAEEIAAARLRLTGEDAMGRLFKVLAAVAPGWPAPEGFGS